MTIGQNGILGYGHLLCFLEDIMANLGPIDFLLGLLLNDNINVNDGQTNFSKNMVIIANFHLKILNRPGRHFCPDLNFEWA